MLKPDARREWIRSRRQRRKQARKARFRRQFLRYTLLCGLLVVGYNGFTRLPWRIADLSTGIEVRGNQVVTDNQVRTALLNVLGKNLYQIDARSLEKQVTGLKAVKHAFVRRYAFPRPKVVVQVLEEFPWATFSTAPDGQPQAVIAESGRMIPIKDFPSITQPPLHIFGKPGLKLSFAEVSQWASWVEFIARQTGQPVQFVDMRSPYDVRVQDSDLFLKLGTPDSTLTRRLGRLTSVLPAITPFKGRLEYVDLSLDNNIPLKIAKKTDGLREN